MTHKHNNPFKKDMDEEIKLDEMNSETENSPKQEETSDEKNDNNTDELSKLQEKYDNDFKL